MKRMIDKRIDANVARSQFGEYQSLCAANVVLRERKDVLPFFSARHDLCMLFSEYIPGIKKADRVGFEFQIYGDFIADLVVGDSNSGKYLLVEFESGTASCIFTQGSKTAPDWAKRFEGAFSQLVDWLWKLEDMRSAVDFTHVFGRRDVTFNGLIVIGKNMNLGPQEESRLKWRQDKLMVDSKGISVVSYDDFLRDADETLISRYHV